ncbi:MAG: hypothetical protein Q8M66_07840, partial [Actinomycetota bacterium]|nr:hypothetical protein [Actinomycetota bacterium]
VPIPDAVQGLSITSSGEQFQLQWQGVPGVSLYSIYASLDPYAPWDQWTYLGQSSGTTYTVSGSARRFYIVRSVGD